MSEHIQIEARGVGGDAEVLGAHYPIPGYGVLPINAFLLRSAEPVLVDAGPVCWSDAYLLALRATIDLAELGWIWLTHCDPDHVGCLRDVLARAPRAKLVTTYLGLGKLGLSGAIPPSRVHLLNPGQTLHVGDRELLAVSPPTYDAPETTNIFDTKTRTLYSSDCFGAVLPEPAESAQDPSPTVLRDGLVLWATVDAPWLASVGAATFRDALERIRALDPARVLGSHLPPAEGMTDALLAWLLSAREAPPFVGPDQRAMMTMMAAE